MSTGILGDSKLSRGTNCILHALNTSYSASKKRWVCWYIFSIGMTSTWKPYTTLSSTIWKGLENIQSRAALLEGVECTCSEERPWTYGLFNLEKRRLRNDLVVLHNFLRKGNGDSGAIPDHQGQDAREWYKAAQGKSQTGCDEKFLYCECSQTLEEAS